MLLKIKKILQENQFRKFLIYGIGQAFNLLTPLLVIPIVISRCGEENLGKIAVSFSMYIFFIAFIDFCSDIIGVKEISKNRNNKDFLNKYISKFYKIKLIMLFTSLLIFSTLILSLDYFQLDKKFYFFGFTVLIGQFLNPTWILQGLEDFKQLTAFNIISKTIYISGVYFTVLHNFDYYLVNFWFGIGLFVASIFVLLNLRNKFGLKYVKTNNREIKEYMINNKTIVFSQVFIWVQVYSVILLVSFFGNKLQAGQFRVIDQVITVFKTYTILSFNFIFTKVCYDFSINKKLGYKNWKIFNGLNLLLITFLCTLLFIYSNEIVTYFNVSNKTFLANLLRIYLIFPILNYINIALKQLLLALDLNKSYVRITMFFTFTNLLGVFLLYKFYNLHGVVYSFIFVESLIIITSILILKNKNFEN